MIFNIIIIVIISVVCSVFFFYSFYHCYSCAQLFLLRKITHSRFLRWILYVRKAVATASIVFVREWGETFWYYSIVGDSQSIFLSLALSISAFVFELLSLYAWIFHIALVLVAFVILLLLLVVYTEVYSTSTYSFIYPFIQWVSQSLPLPMKIWWAMAVTTATACFTGKYMHTVIIISAQCSVSLLAHWNFTTHSDHMMMMMTMEK